MVEINKVRRTPGMSGFSIVGGETFLEDTQSRFALERFVYDKVIGDTPNVENRRFFEAFNTGAITVTDFINGQPGQRIYIVGDGFMTVEHGTFIFTNTGADKLLLDNIMYKFTYVPVTSTTPHSHKWVEDE